MSAEDNSRSVLFMCESQVRREGSTESLYKLLKAFVLLFNEQGLR